MASPKKPKSEAEFNSKTVEIRDVFKNTPTLSSQDAGWRQVDLDTFYLPPGETPEFVLDRYVIGLNVGQSSEISETVGSKFQKATFFQGTSVLCPIYTRHFFCWYSSVETISLSLQPALLDQNAPDILGSERVELIPCFGIQDRLIYQIALALQAELRSQSSDGRLYAETMANALAVHLLRNYSTQGKQSIASNGRFSHQNLRLVIDYIHDNLEQELGLKELAAIAQLSQHHFCRVFKQSTGVSPHQYLIQQRVERAKLLLRRGELGLAEIAIACGFTHQSHLHRHFKRLTGATPKQFISF